MADNPPVRRRYVPKGGYLVDFSERVTPKLRRLLEKEKEKEKRVNGRATVVQESVVPTPECEAQRQTNVGDESKNTNACMAMVVWSGGNGEQASVSEALGHGATRHGSLASTSPSITPSISSSTPISSVSSVAVRAPHEGTTAKISARSTPLVRSSWKPPGCLRQSLWKRPIKPAKKPKGPAPKQSAVIMDPCPTCASLVDEKNALHQHQRALHLKTIKVESLVSKCAREMKEFEAYKADEMKRLSDLKEAFKLKKKRDALAQTAEARASSQHTDLARMRIKVEQVEAALEEQRLKNKNDKDKYSTEIQRYRDKISALKEELSVLNAALADSQGVMATTEGADKTMRCSCVHTPSTPGDYGPQMSHSCGKHGNHGKLSTSSMQGGKEGTVHVHENNTVETRWDDGVVQYVYENGDVRQSDGRGIVEYLYADIECWNTSYPDGDHVYYFKDGRRECHRADGTVQILLDGHQRAYGCCVSQSGGKTTAASIPVDRINPKLLHACPTKRQIV